MSGKKYGQELVFALVLTAATVLVQRAVSKPDVGRTWGMRGALWIKGVARKFDAPVWRDVERRADGIYDRFRA